MQFLIWEFMENMMEYIHTYTLCNKRCFYYDFHVFINMNDKIEKYVDYLIKEINLYQNIHMILYILEVELLSLLNEEQIKRILDNLNKTDDWENEITLELNPSDVDLEKLKAIKNAGVNRLSIGFSNF